MKSLFLAGAAAVALLLGASHAQAQQAPPADSASAAAAPADSARQNATRRPRRNPRLLTAEDIADSRATTAFEAITRLRARWLHDRGPGEKDDAGPVLLQVYRNGQLAGDVDALRQIPAGDIDTIEWVDPVAARVRFGPRAGKGAIVVTDKH